MAGVAAGALALLGAIRGDAWLAVAAGALSGACLGFLPHNLLRSPARIFLGDGGSMPVGFAVAAIAMIGVSDAAAPWQSLAMGLLFVGVPALDTALVVVSRARRGISVLTGGRDHLTHRTRQRLRTARAVAVALGAAQATVSALALVALQAGSVASAAAVLLYALAAGLAIALFDSRLAPEAAVAGPVTTPVEATAGEKRPRRAGRALRTVELGALLTIVPLALIGGLSPFLSGLYSSGLWVPGGLVLVIVATATAIARPARLSPPAVLTLGAAGGLGLWALASSLWAGSSQQAVIDANRILLYVVGLGLLLLVVRSRPAASAALGAFAFAGVAVAIVVLAQMLSGDTSVFLAGRLDQPLGYINGEAALFLLAIWPCLAAAEQRRSALLAGAGAAGMVALASVALLSQSRGIALAAVVSLVAVVALVPDRLRRAWALVVGGVAVAAAAPALLDVYADGVDRELAPGTVRAAATAALLAAGAAGLTWGAISAAAERVPGTMRLRRVTGGVLVVCLAVAVLGAAINASRIADSVSAQYQAFVHLAAEPDPSSAGTVSRLASGSGNRYDYWQVAWNAWEDRPLAGWGAGNYDRPYFEHRSTTEDVRQPHSIAFQALSELGIVGAALLALVLTGAAWAMAGIARSRQIGGEDAAIAAGAVGMCSAWLVHSSVDWTHLLPGPTIGALIGLSVLLGARRAGASKPPAQPRRAVTIAVAAAAGVLLLVTGVSLARQGMTDLYRHRAEAALASNPGKALMEADRALRLDRSDTASYYVKAAALARFDRPREATATLNEATRRDPGDFVTWALLGDLAVRRGDVAQAARHYRRALALNPKDPQLQLSARDPGAQLDGAGG
jgi:UDP-N-acetylmuramyl pentapeptide phosphotransferase/UDP-N-acetylglucosamine-1-phosphate transferase